MDYFKLFYNGGIQEVCSTLVDGFILKFGNSTNFSISVLSLCQSASCMNISMLNGSQRILFLYLLWFHFGVKVDYFLEITQIFLKSPWVDSGGGQCFFYG